MSFKINSRNLQAARTLSLELIYAVPTYNNNDICTLNIAPIVEQPACNLVYVTNNSAEPYNIDLKLYPINDITFVFSGISINVVNLIYSTIDNNPIFTLNSSNLQTRVYYANNKWSSMLVQQV